MAKILIIEDTRDIRSIIREYLESEGYQVQEAGSAKEGMEILERDRPDLILLDIMMPEVSGWDMCETIKADKALKDIPVVVVSSKISKADREKSMSSGAVVHISKPFKFPELLQEIERLLPASD